MIATTKKPQTSGKQRTNKPQFLGGLSLAQVARENQTRARNMAERNKHKDEYIKTEVLRAAELLASVGICRILRTAPHYFATVAHIKDMFRGKRDYIWEHAYAQDNPNVQTAFMINRKRT